MIKRRSQTESGNEAAVRSNNHGYPPTGRYEPKSATIYSAEAFAAFAGVAFVFAAEPSRVNILEKSLAG